MRSYGHNKRFLTRTQLILSPQPLGRLLGLLLAAAEEGQRRDARLKLASKTAGSPDDSSSDVNA